MNKEEQTQKMLAKLNTLIAIVKVAIIKVQKAMELADNNLDETRKYRLNTVHKSLSHVLTTCKRTVVSLEKQLSKDNESASSNAREYVELETMEEYRKFQQLPPITSDEVGSVDIDSLIQRLLP